MTYHTLPECSAGQTVQQNDVWELDSPDFGRGILGGVNVKPSLEVAVAVLK